ncbi:hypothetical protein MASR1M48_17480 [Lactococcus petauri]
MLDPIGVIFTAKDLASATVQKLEQNFNSLDGTTSEMAKKFSTSMKMIGTGMSAMAVGAGILAPLGLATAKAADLQEELLNVRKIAGDNVNIDKLAGELDALAPSLGMTSVELAKIAKGAAVLQVKGNENFIAFVDGASKMATALDIPVEQASMLGSKLLNVFQIPVSQIQNLGSVFNEMANVTVAGADEIINATFRSAGSLKGLGFSAGDVAALSARLIELGLSGEEAGTSLSRAFTSVASQPKDLAKAMGISVDELQRRLGKDAMGTIMGFSEKLAKMPNQAKALGMASQIFGEQGSKAILRLGSDTARLGMLVKTANQGFKDGTSLQKEFSSITEGFNFIMKQVNAGWNSFLSMMGKDLLPIMSAVASTFSNFFIGLLKFLKPFAGLISKTLLFVGGIIFLTGAIVALVGAFKLIMLLMAPLWLAMIPVLKVVLALSAAMALFYLAYKNNFGGFADFVRDTFNKVSLFFEAMLEVISSGEISEALYKNLQDAGILGFVEAVLNAFFKTKSFLSGLFDGFMSSFSRFLPVVEMLWESFKMLGSTVLELMGNIFGVFSGIMGGGENGAKTLNVMANSGRMVGAVLGNVVGALVSGISTIVSGANLVLTIFLKIINAVVNIGKSISEFIGGAIGWVVEKLSGGLLGKLLGKALGVEFSSAQPVDNGTRMPANVIPFPMQNVNPSSAGLPMGNMGADIMPLQAQVNKNAVGQNGNLMQAMMEGAQAPKETVVVSKLFLDSREVASQVNRVNERNRISSGGQR